MMHNSRPRSPPMTHSMPGVSPRPATRYPHPAAGALRRRELERDCRQNRALRVPAWRGHDLYFLDLAPPRPIFPVAGSQRVIALRNPAIRYELDGAEMRDLAHAE